MRNSWIEPTYHLCAGFLLQLPRQPIFAHDGRALHDARSQHMGNPGRQCKAPGSIAKYSSRSADTKRSR